VKQYIYKIIIAVIAVMITFEFTIGKEISLINEKINLFGSVEGRKNIIKSIKKEMRKANNKENYFDEEEKILIRNFLLKIQNEINLEN
tara:strand:+ start:1416 stop:1679 length:264 start_codon:yes stop_codon:yes gene_type:complete